MIKKILILLLILIPVNANALIEVDITRGNLNPLPLAVSPLSVDEVSRKGFERILKKQKIIGVDRFSKYLILCLSNKSYCLIHLGMSGTIHLVQNNNLCNLCLSQSYKHLQVIRLRISLRRPYFEQYKDDSHGHSVA